MMVGKPRWKLAERTMPWRVVMPSGPEGLGERLNEMSDWCMARGRWGTDCFEWPIQLGREPNGTPVEGVCFYFVDESTARGFQERWGGELRHKELPGAIGVAAVPVA